MLKTTKSPDKPALSKNNGSRSASSRNNNSKPLFERNTGNGKVNGYGVSDDGIEYAKKSEKSKGKKLANFWKLSKSKGEKSKKLSKSENLSNFRATKTVPKFLIFGAREVFNCL